MLGIPTADRFEWLACKVYGAGVNSHERLDVLLMAIARFRGADWWRGFTEHWSACDATSGDTEVLDTLLDRMRGEPGRPYTGGDMTLYRGCARGRIKRFSWTADRKVAEGFAQGHRGIDVPDAVIAVAHVPARAIFAGPLSDRQEAEYLVDPDLIEIIGIHDYAHN